MARWRDAPATWLLSDLLHMFGFYPSPQCHSQVVYTAEVKRTDRGGMQKMHYNDFLTGECSTSPRY